MTVSETKTLTFHHRYLWDAVYLDGTLVYWGESCRDWSLLQALGYQCERGVEIPTHNMPHEFSSKWTMDDPPPQTLSVLQKQIAAWQERERLEQIERLRGELERLQSRSVG